MSLQPGVHLHLSCAIIRDPGEKCILEPARIITVGGQRSKVAAGDTVCIPAGTPHKVTNTGRDDTIKILCCCCPPYRHDDTEVLE